LTSLLDNVIQLLNLGVGDIGRLEHIKNSLEENKTLYSSDRMYVEKLIGQHIPNQNKSEPDKNLVIDKPVEIINRPQKKWNFSKKKNYECLECEENFEKREELINHGKTIHNLKVIKCPICNMSFLHFKSMDGHTKEHKVSLAIQIVLWFIPLISLWTFIRIQRFTKMIIVNLISFGAMFIPVIILGIVNPNHLDPIFETPIHNEIFGVLSIGYIYGVMFIPSLFFLIKWSIEWNKRIDTQIESLSKEEPKQD